MLGYGDNSMTLTAIILQLISGGVGGNVAGAVLSKLNLGPVANSILGIIGGLITGQVVNSMGSGGVSAAAAAATAAANSGFDMSSILANVGGAGIGGAVLTAVVGLIKSKISKTA
jgi:uncharacterized membrane protein YeaQ/YmgE (transglycosylase-associated protein family)